ncbi:MAG: efflux RND transporter permease subunit, partial [Acidobacteriota bacterium]
MSAERAWTTLFYRNGHLLGATLGVVAVAGVLAWIGLPQLEDPRIVNRDPLALTPVPGASAERVEALVTEVLEDALAEIEQISSLESTSRDGLSVVRMKLAADLDDDAARKAVSEIRDALAGAAADLPPEALPTEVDYERDPAAFTLIVALHADDGHAVSLGVLGRLAEDLADRLREVEGTELVRIYGEAAEEIVVTADADRLAELGLPTGSVAAALAAADVKRPAGLLRGSADLALEVRGAFDDVARVAAVPVGDGAAALTRVGDVASVTRGVRTPASDRVRIDGRTAVLVAARMESGQIARWSERAGAVVAAMQRGAGTGIVFRPVFEQERYTTARLRELGGNLLAGAGVVLLVVLVAMGWRLALVIGSALPLVVAAVLFGLLASGEALHQMSIFGLIIALGLLIDNAIVVADDVAQRRSAGARPLAAVDGAVRHLALPLLASTATTILAFSPILLLPGSAGDFVGTIGESVIWALAASYLLSMTVVAALAGRMLRRRSVAVRRGSAVDRVVGRGLLGAQRRPLIAVVVALFLPIAGFLSARTLGSEFFPPVDRDLFELRLWLGDAAALATTVELTEVIDRELLAHDGVERVDWRIGGSFPSVFYNLVEGQDGASNAAHAIVSTRDPSATKALLGPLQERLDARFPQARIVLRQFAQGPALDADVELRITGPDLGTLRTLGERARLTLQQHPDVLHTRSSLTSGVPKLWIDADEDAARLAGLTLGDVAGQVGGRLEGTVGGSVLEGLARLPVRVQVASDVRADRAALAALPLVAAGGERLPLEAVARFELEPQLGAITRLDRERVNTLGGFTRPGALPIDVASNVVENLEQEGFALPSGYRLELGGAVEQDATAKGNLALYAPLLGTLTVAILVLTFRSVALAALLLVVAGLSVGPGLIGTRLLGLPISFNTILGTLGLVGLAFNNSIVVLASIRSDAAARRGDLERIAQRAAASTRHIVATTLTTIGGFLPLLLFVGGDFWPSLAIVMAGGVAGSAILALLFVPVVYGHVVARLERTPLRQEKRLALATTA